MLKRIVLFILLTTLVLTGCTGNVDSPPKIKLVANGESLDGFQGPYCWDKGIGAALCVDPVLPYFESTTQLSTSVPIQLQFDKPLPTEATISLSKEVFGDVIASGSLPLSELAEWSPNVAPGEYIMVVSAKWKQGDTSYYFSISLK